MLGTEICTGVLSTGTLGTEIATAGVGGTSMGGSAGWMGRVGCGGCGDWTLTGGDIGGTGTGAVELGGVDPGPTGFCADPCDPCGGPGSAVLVLGLVFMFMFGLVLLV
jgi:hypothetical protein